VSEIDLPFLAVQTNSTGFEILEIIDELGGDGTVPKITDQTARSKSTVTRHISQLEESSAVRSEMHGKTKYVELTFTGALLLQIQRH
jgi:CRISPR-associated protein Csa3